MSLPTAPFPRKREFLPENFKVTVWSKLKPYYRSLLLRQIEDLQQLKRWIWDQCEINAAVEEDLAWRQIELSRDVLNQRAIESFQYAVHELTPKIKIFQNELNQKLLALPLTLSLEKEKFNIYLRSIQNELELFNKENTDLLAELRIKSKEYNKIIAEISIQINGEKLSIQSAYDKLNHPDRSFREMAFRAIHQQLLAKEKELQKLFSDLLGIRQKVAENADYSNFRDFQFKALERFDYDPEDCLQFHEAIKKEVLPIVENLDRIRKRQLNVDRLMPWDLQVDFIGLPLPQPFEGTKDLLDKTIICLRQLHPYFASCLTTIQDLEHFDIEARPGKRCGAFHIHLPLVGVPFIFMNSTNSIRDLRTILHESGHAIHAFLYRDYRLGVSRRPPPEMTELAAMTLELLSMDYWDVYFRDKDELNRAKIWQLERVIKTLPWVAAIDKFQHWLYIRPDHTLEERREAWLAIVKEFTSKEVDYRDIEDYQSCLWFTQLHIFEFPFYYIEYAVAQLGAIAIWRKFQTDPGKTKEQYLRALSLGYTKTIPEVYEEAGIAFDFSQNHVKELILYVKKELDKLMVKQEMV